MKQATRNHFNEIIQCGYTVTAIIVVGIGLGLLLNHFIPCKDYTTPLFIVLAIHIYLEDMFEKERMKKGTK